MSAAPSGGTDGAPPPGANERPWLARYRSGTQPSIEVEVASPLEAFQRSVQRCGAGPAIRYFDGTITFADLDARSTALAGYLLGQGFGRGDRLAVYTQNNPAFVVALLAAWKAGGAVVPINPMNKARELAYLLNDSGATALLCLDELWEGVARDVVGAGGTAVRIVVTASARDDQTRDDARLFSASPDTDRGERGEVASLREILTADRGALRAPTVTPAPDDIALLTYTSGTTGEPKGATNTHANMAFTSQVYRDWVGIGGDDVVLGVAPLFHITGLVGHVGLSLLTGAPLVLAHRFEPTVMMDAIREWRPTFTIGAVTAFTALLSVPGSREDWSSFRALYTGGAAVAPAVADRVEVATGLYLHNAYGMTETTSPTHLVPLGATAPVDPTSGALSIGVPVFDTTIRIVGDDGAELPAGQVGEIVSSGPQIVPGYWNRPDATAATMPDGHLHTGDVGVMNADGWFFIVDRKKDMINAAGYKVWPREVEDVLYGHPAVREVAVVGVPDEYRGETVKAFVSLVPGATITGDALVAWSKEQMAAYKYPRTVEIIEELPKTTTGKILRRQLRE